MEKIETQKLIKQLTKDVGENMEAQETLGKLCYEIGRLKGRCDALEIKLKLNKNKQK